MRKLYTTWILFLFSVCITLHAQTNRALIIAVSDYPVESGWEKTHAVNDCDLVIPMLEANGYQQADIQVLKNEEATKQAIVNTIRELTAAVQPGDYIYLQFSGHGQQMADDNGDELDQLDEAFIPYDAHFRFTPGKYEGENHLRDDELELLMDGIRRRTGEKGNLTIVLDACHSGTGTRNNEEDEYVRGTSYIFAPDDFDVYTDNFGPIKLNLNKSPGLSPVTVFSACQPDQLNYEYRTPTRPVSYYGSLSYFFCELVKEQKTEASVQTFYLRLKDKMEKHFRKKGKEQSPYFESTDKNLIFRLNNY